VCSNGTIYVPSVPLDTSNFKTLPQPNGSISSLYDTSDFEDTIGFQSFQDVVQKWAISIKTSEASRLQISVSIFFLLFDNYIIQYFWVTILFQKMNSSQPCIV